MSRFSQKLCTAAVLATYLVSGVQAKDDRICPDDFLADPSTDQCNPLRYIPNQAVNIVALVLYFIVAVILTWQNYRHRANYMLCLVIGAYFEGLGLALRLPFRNNPHSNGLYIVQYLFVVLSPCAFLAGDYILLGRIINHLGVPEYIRPFKANLISRIFIISDVCTFLIQAAGGGLSTANDIKLAETGGHIFLAGIAAQLASFILFSCIWVMFAYRVYYQDKVLWSKSGWKSLHFSLGFTCVAFSIRSVYRTIELSQGYVGYLATHERFFLGLDTLPLFLGITTYTWFWPGKYLTPETRAIKEVAPEPVSESPSGDVQYNNIQYENTAEPKDVIQKS